MHSTCGNVSNVYSLVDQSALGCTIFAVRATCALWRLAQRRDDTWDWPDYDLTTNVSCRNTYIVDTKLSLVVQRYGWTNAKLEKDETCFGLRPNRLPDWKLLPIRIETRIVGDMTLAEWQSSLLTRCSNLDIQLLAITNRIEDYIEIDHSLEWVNSIRCIDKHRANSKR